jgi:hypothetical protein
MLPLSCRFPAARVVQSPVAKDRRRLSTPVPLPLTVERVRPRSTHRVEEPWDHLGAATAPGDSPGAARLPIKRVEPDVLSVGHREVPAARGQLC